MYKITKTFLLMLSLFLLYSGILSAQQVYQVSLKEDVGPNSWRTIDKAYDKAVEQGASIFLIDMNTFGGALTFADSIRTKLLHASMTTVVYVNNNAASAGALIALAADSIYMQSGASLGAAAVVNQKGEVMAEKYQSYMRGLMRATAEAKGRDPNIAEAFVDGDVALEGWKPAGKLLTLTSSEAVAAGVALAEVSSVDQVYKRLATGNTDVTIHQLSLVDKIIALLIHPMVSSLLILGIIAGIYFELQTPGIGFALLLAVVCSLLFFAPLYLQGLADHWEIAVFGLGVLLLFLEIFVIPGFGVAGILGIIMVVCGLAFAMVSNNYLDFNYTGTGVLMNAFLIVLGSVILSIVLMVIFGRDLLRSKSFQRLVLADEQQADQGYTSSVPMHNLIHQHGVARTVLRPSGKIEIHGVWYDAVALDGFIDAGDAVYVEKHENYNLFVRKLADVKV